MAPSSLPSHASRALPLFLPLLLLLLASPVVHAAKVLELSPQTIDAYITRSADTPLLLEFYAPWCKHCTLFAPSYRAVALELSTRASVVRVDAWSHKVLALRFRVRAFPAFFLVHKGRVHEYVGPREVDAMVAFVDSRGDDSRLAKSHDYFFGPLNPYWRAVGLLFRASSTALTKIRTANLSQRDVIGIAAATILGLISLFILLIYILTKPPLVKPPLAHSQHAHTD